MQGERATNEEARLSSPVVFPVTTCQSPRSREYTRMVKVFGRGKDTIEVEADNCPSHQKYVKREAKGVVLGCSDGTLLEVSYLLPHLDHIEKPTDITGRWQITVIHQGSAKLIHSPNVSMNGDCTDLVTLEGDIEWIVCSHEYKLRSSKKSCVVVPLQQTKKF